VIHCAYAVLHLLFAIKALKRQSPVAFLAGKTDPSRAAELLRSCGEWTDTEMLEKIALALVSIARVVPSDDDAAKKLHRERSWAWSSNIPGIVMLIDVFERASGSRGSRTT
jgi:hypothetical protein